MYVLLGGFLGPGICWNLLPSHQKNLARQLPYSDHSIKNSENWQFFSELEPKEKSVENIEVKDGSGGPRGPGKYTEARSLDAESARSACCREQNAGSWLIKKWQNKKSVLILWPQTQVRQIFRIQVSPWPRGQVTCPLKLEITFLWVPKLTVIFSNRPKLKT